MLGLTFFSKLDWGSYIISVAETASIIHSMKFLFPEVALYLYKSTICPCMEYCCHVWAGASICYLECQTNCKNEYTALLIIHLLLLLNPWLIVEIWLAEVFSIVITLVDVLQNWLNWFPFLFLVGGLLVIHSNRLHDFSVTIPRCYKDVYVSSFFSLAQLDSGILCLQNALL